MDDMRSDINKYAKIWDKALEDGIFKDVTPPATQNAGVNFFGQPLTDEYDIDEPLNEAEISYWRSLAAVDSLTSGAAIQKLNEESDADVKNIKHTAKKQGSSYNPIYPDSVDADAKYKEELMSNEMHDKLVAIKDKIETLQKKIAEMKGSDKPKAQKQLEKLKANYDELANSNNTNRFTSKQK